MALVKVAEGQYLDTVTGQIQYSPVSQKTISKKPLALDIAKGVTALQQAASKGINSPESKSYMTLTNNKIKTEKPKSSGMSAMVEGVKELFKSVGNKTSGFLLPTDSKYKNVNIENERKYLQNLYETGNEGQKDFAKRQAKLYGIQLKEPQALTQTIQPGSQIGFKGIPGVTTTGQGANAPIVESILDKGVPKLTNLAQQEIARKAKAGIPLTNPTPLAQAYYDSVKQSLQSTPVVKEGIVVQEKPITEEKTVTDNQIAPSDTSTMKETPSSKAYSDLIEAQKAKTISELDTIKQQALGKIGQQQAAINPQFEAQRTQAATQSMQQARNFAEYMAARGQTNAGITAQAELSRGSGLTRQLGEIGQQQQAAQQDVAMRRSVIEQDYLNKIANATTEAEIQKAAKEYQDLVKNEERTYQESRDALKREQQLTDIASSRQFARQQSEEQRQFAREQQQAPTYDFKTDPNFAAALTDLSQGDISQNIKYLENYADEYIKDYTYPGYIALLNEARKRAGLSPVIPNF